MADGELGIFVRVRSAQTQGYASNVENGLLELTGERLTLVAAALDCPVQLLIEREAVRQVEVTCLHHRRRQSKMTVAAMKRIEAIAHRSRLTAERLLEPVGAAGLALRARNNHPPPAEAAQDLRSHWDLPDGPVKHVIRKLEQAGVVVIVRDLGTTTQDAVSVWPPGESQLPTMLVNTGFPPDRQRFTVCHGLGHLLLHQFPAEEQEREANQFAAEFLVLAAEIRPYLEGLQTHHFKRLMELKRQSGVCPSGC